jgi:hypothetical protein
MPGRSTLYSDTWIPGSVAPPAWYATDRVDTNSLAHFGKSGILEENHFQ